MGERKAEDKKKLREAGAEKKEGERVGKEHKIYIIYWPHQFAPMMKITFVLKPSQMGGRCLIEILRGLSIFRISNIHDSLQMTVERAC